MSSAGERWRAVGSGAEELDPATSTRPRMKVLSQSMVPSLFRHHLSTHSRSTASKFLGLHISIAMKILYVALFPVSSRGSQGSERRLEIGLPMVTKDGRVLGIQDCLE